MNLVIGKNSFLSKIFDNWDNTVLISYKDIDNIKLSNFSSLYLLSFPNEYHKKSEKDFEFEKNIFKNFLKKRIFYFSTSKVYRNKINCNESDPAEPQGYYGENKYKIENIITTFTEKFLIYRVSNVFTKTDFSRNTFFDKVIRNIEDKNIINFDINEKSLKDFISINSLRSIISQMNLTDESGIFNIGSEIGLPVEEILRNFLTNTIYESLEKKYSKNIINQTLEISKLSKVINIDKEELHENTIKELRK